MSESKPIPTPTRLQMARMRYQFMPALMFVVALSLTGLLWKNYSGTANATGEVNATTVRVVANTTERSPTGPITRAFTITSTKASPWLLSKASSRSSSPRPSRAW